MVAGQAVMDCKLAKDMWKPQKDDKDEPLRLKRWPSVVADSSCEAYWHPGGSFLEVHG